MEIRDNLQSETGWDIREPRFDADQIITNGSNYLTGNGYLGYRGTFPEWKKDRYVACTVTDTWDNADGKWSELCTVPNALFLSVSETGHELEPLGVDGEIDDYTRELDFRYGIQRRGVTAGTATDARVRLEDERYASYANLHLVPARMTVRPDRDVELVVRSGIDAEVWSLNGDHFARHEPAVVDSMLQVRSTTGERGRTIVVTHAARLSGGEVSESAIPVREGDSIYRDYAVLLAGGEELEIVTLMSVFTSADTGDGVGPPAPDPAAESLAAARAFLATGYDAALAEHRAEWDSIWAESEVEIDGDELAAMLLRYNMYQNFIATPAHTDHLPIGARGLSCQAYQGAAFWDQEIFNLPVYLYSRPEVARNILTYRYRTLDGARRKAAALGYRGAFYAWISADTGEEICPSFFFKDVLSGRPIHNHFNDWQIHVSPDIAYTVWKYYQATDDYEFLERYGAEIVFEVTRFLASRVHYRPQTDRYEFIRLLGPDEYHENVDNNFFTAYQARYVVRRALSLLELLGRCSPRELEALREKIALSDDEIELWTTMAEKISVNEPDSESRLIEQFDGFFELEDVSPSELATRLQDKGEYWGWPNGIAVETQVSKQADVTQLFALHPHAYSREVMRANYDYYEPRTQHGSSLSYSVYAMVAAWIRDLDEAHRYFIRSCSVDLMNTGKAISGGTFIGGIHTAACGAAWQICVSGFAGVTVNDEGLSIEPRLPAGWGRLAFGFVYHGRRIRVICTHDAVEVIAEAGNLSPIALRVGETSVVVEPGTSEVTELAR